MNRATPVSLERVDQRSPNKIYLKTIRFWETDYWYPGEWRINAPDIRLLLYEFGL